VRRKKSVLAAMAVIGLAFGGVCALVLGNFSAVSELALSAASTTSLCQEAVTSVSGGTYHVQNNEYDSGASECISTNDDTSFSVTNSSIDNATDGSPGGYPSIYQGCHWGNCSSGGLTTTPIKVSDLTTGEVTTSWSTTQPGGDSAYDVAYDIWFNQTPTTTGQPDCAEIMVWLNHDGSVQPFGSQVASDVSLGGHSYNVWEGGHSWGNTITYDMTTAATSVSDLDVGTLAQDAVSRGFMSNSCYLIDVEAGFELWQGGAGLATDSFSVNVGGASGSAPAPAPAPSPSPSPSASTAPAPASSGSCSASYSVASSWRGGFRGRVVIRNTGSQKLDGWKLGWTFPDGQRVRNLWDGSATQSGEAVTVTNKSYNGTVAVGGTVTVGFTGTDTGDNTSPSSVSCN
jgi:Glycosyl hydrolase family 12/Cellulose binding domain